MVFTGISMIDELVGLLTKRLEKGLPGAAAQIKMAPAGRSLNSDSSISPQNSSVLILLFPVGKELKVVLIKRTDVGLHGGQMSLPGGKQDSSDSSHEETALRELSEEVGINPRHVKIITGLTPLFVPPSNFIIYPFIGVIDYSPVFIPNPEEVEEIITVSINDLISSVGTMNYTGQDGVRISGVPCYNVNGHTVWGATAMILSELEELLK